MTTPPDPHTDRRYDPARRPEPDSPTKHGGHGWMMIACCVPMLVIVVVLAATGVIGFGFVFAAIACTVMMAVMMRGMGRRGDGRM